ncbi:hypothetical protein R3P38DRAFT_242737 [Favolaschia claudopus]|uniref:Uncharacterized protein n=1 Tax=Favolaschia claudopus TaxID=2862362 RepID=A0AAW0CWD9_9AGAR
MVLQSLSLILFGAAGALALHVPGCAPGEDASVVSESVFQVPDPNAGFALTNLMLAYFTCASRQALFRNASKHQTLIDLCGIMDSSSVFSSTFNCIQGPGPNPKVRDCLDVAAAVTDSESAFLSARCLLRQHLFLPGFIRPMEVVIPALEGLAVSMANNSCAFVFLNDDANDDYSTCFHTIPDMAQDIGEECIGEQDGFVGFVRSPIQPGVQNWEVHIVASKSLDN